MARAPDGRVVFVSRTAPGELVEVELTEEHKQWLRGRLVRVIESSPARRDPPCPHYVRCGGCQLQHLKYETQLSAKTSIIAESLRRIGGFDVSPPQIVPSARELGYRNRISLVLRREGSGFAAGYHAYDNPAEVVGIDNCPLAEPAVNAVWSSLAALWRREPEKLPHGQELRLTLRANSKGEAGLAIENARKRGGHIAGTETRRDGLAAREVRERARPGAPKTRERGGTSLAGGLVGSVRGLVAVWRLDPRGTIVRHEGAKSLIERVGPYEIPLAGTAFLQVNRDTASRLDSYVRAQCGAVRGKRVIDAYCGYGMRAIEMARDGAEVTGIDKDRHAIKAGGRIASQAGAPVRLVAAGVEHSLRHELPADTVILNPPRSGLMRPVVDALSSNPTGRIVYVSCNPATLARDLKRLAGPYELAAVLAFDLFPQTAHIETVVTLNRRTR